jgi:hypothetical protein
MWRDCVLLWFIAYVETGILLHMGRKVVTFVHTVLVLIGKILIALQVVLVRLLDRS